VRIKRFFAKDMRTALAEVKEELGADAVIMSNKKVTGGVEIMAAVDVLPPEPAATQQAGTERALPEETVKLSVAAVSKKLNPFKKTPESQASGQAFADTLASLLERQQPEQARANGASQSVVPGSLLEQGLFHSGQASEPPVRTARPSRRTDSSGERREMLAMQQEMSSIRQLLQHQLAGLMQQEQERQAPLRSLLISNLNRVGFSPDVAARIASRVPEDEQLHQVFDGLRRILNEQILVGEDDILRRGGAVALLGPTGVGKTTTVAKLAARFAMHHGPDQVAMITTDTYRIGACEQLSTYGRIMGCPVKVVRNSEELSNGLYQLRDRRLVLIDTAGMSQRDLRLSEQLETLVKNSRIRIRSYLVMAATAQRRILEDTLQHFRRIPLSGCILTKIDECLSLGDVLSVTIAQGLPLVYLTNGQRVPEDISVASGAQLVDTIMETMARLQPGYAIK